MVTIITGGCKNGKSNKAQALATELAHKKGVKLYYVATMVSTGKEDDERIKKHIESRKGLGFETIELPRGIISLTEYMGDIPGVFLVDSLTALLANEMFRIDDDGDFFTDHETFERVKNEIEMLTDRCRSTDTDIIFVSDGIYSDALLYEKETIEYRKALAGLERAVGQRADEVIEMCAGVSMSERNDCSINGRAALVFGGAAQGKTEFVIKNFGLKPSDIYSFSYEDASVPQGYAAYAHIERLLRKMIETETLNGETDTASAAAYFFPNDSILIMDDVTCGIVPVDELDRRWREECGRLMQMLGRGRKIYRILCGRGMKIK